MKMADVTPFCKKESRAVKNDYCPANILTNLPKVFERYLYKQFSPYFDNIFSKKQCGFRKNYNAQHCLLPLLENSWVMLTREKFVVHF